MTTMGDTIVPHFTLKEIGTQRNEVRLPQVPQLAMTSVCLQTFYVILLLHLWDSMILPAKEIPADRIGWETDSKDGRMHMGNRQKPISKSTTCDSTNEDVEVQRVTWCWQGLPSRKWQSQQSNSFPLPLNHGFVTTPHYLPCGSNPEWVTDRLGNSSHSSKHKRFRNKGRKQKPNSEWN